MKLKKQLQSLVKEAPQHGVSSVVMEKAINPVLAMFAKQLEHPKYYLLSNANGDWLLTHLSHRERSEQEKTVIYAFSTPEDAALFHKNTETNLLKITAIPVTHLLFQLLALKQVDSIIFMAISGNLEKGIEVPRTELQDSIQKQLAQGRSFIV
ncbi:hypothetical protein [Gloeothece verrucosa]|uniref:SseB protein N-terminal domain-containing protein n=1 Tax=Gloeothece verrucosa (strain PCC 7822) TaxID=497965 RepID=E0UKC9_GLOV7|nr:hypothetical protein [Gloeothece verrucosa]ADN17010.1 conserved hypothetical protein [Gloeothece verrucosa PCC 7822]